MKNAITTLRIQNFKSIRDVTMQPRRVNIIIGEPNVGKSNVLEAISLLGSVFYEQSDKFLGSFIRYEEPRQLFYDNLVANTIKVETDKDVAVLLFEKVEKVFQYAFCDLNFYEELAGQVVGNPRSKVVGKAEHHVMRNVLPGKLDRHRSNGVSPEHFTYTEFDKDGIVESVNQEIADDYHETRLLSMAYRFSKNAAINQDSGNSRLSPPHGSNLIEVLQTNAKLRKDVGRLFEPYDQKLQLRADERRLEIIRDKGGITYAYPYSSVADTLQRIIFYLAAIESNTDSVLLFEEPEAHSFPEYVIQLAERIVGSRDNQFFVVTHSPYLTTEVLEQMVPSDELLPELAVFVAYYEDYQTKIRQLSDEELIKARANGTELFLNLRQFVPGSAEFVPSSGA